jgi:tetratricopeptide (TPR) repeat protein
MMLKKTNANKEGAATTPVKSYIFSFLLFATPVLFFVILELALRIFHYGQNLDLFVSAPDKLAKYKIGNIYVGRRYFSHDHTTWRSDLFLKQKPANGYRIFVLGGSTAIGYPYDNNVMFSRILQYRLADTFPDRYIEVVNTAMTATNSYTQLDFMDEIMENEPDAILIYAGHNEFYGALGISSTESVGKFRWLIKLYLKLNRFRTFILLKDIIRQIKGMFNENIDKQTLKDQTATLMERMVGNQKIFYADPVYRLGKRQFKQNLRDIYRKAQEKNVPVLISELVSNIRDQNPFISEARDSLPAAATVYQQAKVFEEQRQYIQAKKTYYRAKDLDLLRFRATEDFNDILRTVAGEFHMPVVPMKRYFEQNSPNALIGDNLMTDHLHPNISGSFLMADAFFNSMKEHKFISDDWKPDRIKPAQYYRENWGITGLDTIYADLSIRFLKGGWPFQTKSEINYALDNYIPKTKVDSVALKNFLNRKDLFTTHSELAEYYKNNNQYEKAFKEYEALYYTLPHETDFYIQAARMLLKMNRYQDAFKILNRSLHYHDTAFAYKWIGQILLINKKLREGILCLEKARSMKDMDIQLLYNLARAYIMTRNYMKADEIIGEFKRQYPNSPKLMNLEKFYMAVREKLNNPSLLQQNKK